MKSVRLFLARHFGSKQVVENISKDRRSGERQPDARCYAGLGLSASVSNNGGKGQAHYAGCKDSMLNNEIGAGRFNQMGIQNIQNHLAEFNRFTALSHRSFVLYVDANGQAYALDGSKWSRQS